MRTLTYEGYLIRRPDGSYALGMAIASRFRDLVASMERPPGIHEVLKQISETTGFTAYFAQLMDGQVVLTDLYEGPRSPHLEDLVVGFDDGAHATALGKALLSTMAPGRRRDYLRQQGLRPFTGNTLTDPDALNHELTLSARDGLFTEQEQYRDDVCCAAVVVGGVSPGAIGVSVPAGSWAGINGALLRQLQIRGADLG